MSEYPVTATSRSKDQLWAAVNETWTDLMTRKGTLRVNRNVSALEKNFKKIRKGVSTFTSHHFTADDASTDLDDSSDEEGERGSTSSPTARKKGLPAPTGRHQGRQAHAVGRLQYGEASKGDHGGCAQADCCAARAHCALLL